MSLETLNIAMLSVHSCPMGELGTRDTGGMSVYIRELAKELGKRGHSVDIFTRCHGGLHRRAVELGENVRLMHIQAGDPVDGGKLAVYPHIREFARELDEFRTVENIAYDIIHSHYWLSGVAGNIVRKWWNLPHMIMFHTLGAIKNTLNIGQREPDCRICSESALVRTCRRIIAPTIKEKQEMIRFYDASPEAIAVIPCGVNQELFRPFDRKEARTRLGYGMDENIVLYVGRVEPLKGISRLIQAVAYLKDRIGLKLVIVGGDDPNHPHMRQVIDLSKALKIEDRVKFAGRVAQSGLPDYYSAADALVVASLYESFGLVALEAMSCGIPVVSTTVGGMRNIVRRGETGCLVADDTVPAMGNSILDIFAHREFYRQRSGAIRDSVSGYSWKNIANSVIEEYRCVAEDHKRKNRMEQPPGHDLDFKRVSCG